MGFIFKYKWVWGILIVGLILFMFFGPSKIQQMREARAVKRNKSLVQKIVDNAKKHDKNSSMLSNPKKAPPPTGLKYGMDTSADILPKEGGAPSKKGNAITAPDFNEDEDSDIDSGDAKSTPEDNGFLNPFLSGKAVGTSNSGSTAGGNGSKPAGRGTDVYYPPAVPTKPGKGGGGKPQSELENSVPAEQQSMFSQGYGVVMSHQVPVGTPSEKHPNERVAKEKKDVFVAFQGTKAYYVGDDGKPAPVPDGYYQLPGSNHKFLIINGEKTVPN